MSKSLIKYSLFQSRKKFNPLSLFHKNNNLTYEEFVMFLENKAVQSPGIKYFNKVKDSFKQNKDTNHTTISTEEKELKKNIPEDIDKSLETQSIIEPNELVEVAIADFKSEVVKLKSSQTKRRGKTKKKKEEVNEKTNID